MIYDQLDRLFHHQIITIWCDDDLIQTSINYWDSIQESIKWTIDFFLWLFQAFIALNYFQLKKSATGSFDDNIRCIYHQSVIIFDYIGCAFNFNHYMNLGNHHNEQHLKIKFAKMIQWFNIFAYSHTPHQTHTLTSTQHERVDLINFNQLSLFLSLSLSLSLAIDDY